jgi:hypothetical protein
MEETMKQEEVRIPFDWLCLAVFKALHTLSVQLNLKNGPPIQRF